MPGAPFQVLIGIIGTTQIPQATGTPIGNMISGGGLAAAFDGVTSQTSVTGARAVATANGTVGKDWGAGQLYILKQVIFFGPNDDPFRGDAAAVAYTIEGSTDNFASSIVALQSGTTPSAINPGSVTVTGLVQTPFQYHRLNLVGNSANALNVAEIQFFI